MSRSLYNLGRQRRRPQPCPVLRADWQPGLIEGSESKRIYLDGEPIAGAIAASYVEGWVIVAVGRGGDEEDPDGLVTPFRAGSTRTLHGYIEVRPE